MPKILLVLLAPVFVLALAGEALAQEYPPEGGALRVDSSIVAAGGHVTVTGDGCGPDETVAIVFDEREAGSTIADGAGAFSEAVDVPSGASSGTDTITATCGTRVLSTDVTVASAEGEAAGGGTPGAGDLPRTDSDNSVSLVWLGLAALAFGTAAVVFARRRARAREAG